MTRYDVRSSSSSFIAFEEIPVVFPFVHQVLHEELLYANFINPFRPGDAMTSITYVQRVEQHPNGKRKEACGAIGTWCRALFDARKQGRAQKLSTLGRLLGFRSQTGLDIRLVISSLIMSATTAHLTHSKTSVHLTRRARYSVSAGVLEKLRVRTIGLRDTLAADLAGKPLSLDLFEDDGLRTKE